MKINSETISEAARVVAEIMGKELNPEYSFHNMTHTLEVVKGAAAIAEGMELDFDDTHTVLMAAWFHDLGYIQGGADHEQRGADMAAGFLRGKKVEEQQVDAVMRCILSTRFPQNPEDLLCQVLCDADLLHLAGKGYKAKLNALRKEWEFFDKQVYSDEVMVRMNIEFLKSQQFHTAWCRENFDKGKNKNIRKMESWLESILEENQEREKEVNAVVEETVIENAESKAEKKEKERLARLERGVETMFRTTSHNHMELSGMADSKANILISINATIITIIISVLFTKLENNPHLIIPTIILMLVCLATIVISILSTRPKVSSGRFTREQINQREVNLLFFGNFHDVPLADYEWAIRGMMYDKEYLYSSMTRDIYFLGKVLASKYRYLNIAFNVFMYGLICAVAAFGISFFFRNPAM